MNKLRYRFRIWKQIAPHFQGIKMWYAGDILSEIIIRITAMMIPVFYGIFLEKVILGKHIQWLGIVLLGYVFLQLIKSAGAIFQKHCQNKVNNTVYRKMRVLALGKYFQMKYEKYAKIGTGDIKMTLEDGVNRIYSFQTQFYQYCINVVFIIIVTASLVGINWRLAIIALFSLPVTFILDHLVSRSEKNVNHILNENNASWTTWVDETIKGWKEIRINKCEDKRKQEFADFQTVDENWFTIWLRYWTTRVMAIPKMKDDFIMQFLLYFTGGILIYYKYMSIGMLLVFVQYYGILSDSVKAVSSSDAELQSEMPHYERILKHLDTNGSVVPDDGVLPEQYDISFENVTFKYPDTERNVLNNVSFHVNAGDRVGVYGESGSGKSTILKLMLGQLEPDAGNITYGGISLKNIHKNKLYKKIAYISQEARLFNESILENIRMGREDAPMEEVEEASRRACIYDFIASQPKGFETEIGENGALLSGGQRQRLLLARALLKDADLYIFDEATSALDYQVEEQIINTLQCIPRNKTVMIVAHGENILEMCDYVIKLA